VTKDVFAIINGNGLMMHVILYRLVCKSIQSPHNANIYMVNFLVEVFRNKISIIYSYLC